jgi:hypothetical protein
MRFIAESAGGKFGGPSMRSSLWIVPGISTPM